MNPLLVGIASSMINKFANAEENERAQDMMALQNKYAQQNAAISYGYSRMLTRDAPELEKEGKAKAGINTAFGQNGNVTSVSSGPMPSSPSVPSPLGNGQNITNSIGVLSQLSAQDSTIKLQSQQEKLLAEQTENQRIKNITQLLHDKEEARKIGNEADKVRAEEIYQSKINKYADDKLSNEADIIADDAFIKHSEAAVINQKLSNELAIEEKTIEKLGQEGILTKEQVKTEIAKRQVMRSEVAKNYSDVHRNDVLNDNTESDTEGKNLDNRFNTLTFNSRLVSAFENAKQSKLKTIAMRLANLPKSVSEHFTRSAMFALQRIQKGKGSAADYALVASQTAREAVVYGNEQAKDWTKILLGAIPGSSSGAASSSSNSPITFSSTSY